MKSTQWARHLASSIEVCSIYVLSYFPNNYVRVGILRLWGASVPWSVAIHHGLQVRAARRLTIGDDVFLAEDVVLDARGGLKIGNHTSINSRVMIWSAQHDWKSPQFAYSQDTVTIGNRCWVSAGTIVLPGRSIGEGAVVGAGSVVSRDVGPWTLAAGNPAVYIKDRPSDLPYELNARAFKIKFW